MPCVVLCLVLILPLVGLFYVPLSQFDMSRSVFCVSLIVQWFVGWFVFCVSFLL